MLVVNPVSDYSTLRLTGQSSDIEENGSNPWRIKVRLVKDVLEDDMEHPKAVCDSAYNELCKEGCHHHHPSLAALLLLHASLALGCDHNHLDPETAKKYLHKLNVCDNNHLYPETGNTLQCCTFFEHLIGHKFNRTQCPDDAKTVEHQTCRKQNSPLKFTSLTISPGTVAAEWLLITNLLSVQL